MGIQAADAAGHRARYRCRQTVARTSGHCALIWPSPEERFNADSRRHHAPRPRRPESAPTRPGCSSSGSAGNGRYLMFCDLKPVIVCWTRPDVSATAALAVARRDCRHSGLAEAECLFLGLDRAERRAAFRDRHRRPSRAQPLPGAVELLRPAVDLRIARHAGPAQPRGAVARRPGAGARAMAREPAAAASAARQRSSRTAAGGGNAAGCGLDWFPRTDPVVIMLVTDGERCILAHEHRYQNNMYSTLAGFLEPGEDIEHAVRREVLEETNIKVGRVAYHSSQPWPFPHSLMMGCIGLRRDDRDHHRQERDREARWFSRDECRARCSSGRHPEGLTAPAQARHRQRAGRAASSRGRPASTGSIAPRPNISPGPHSPTEQDPRLGSTGSSLDRVQASCRGIGSAKRPLRWAPPFSRGISPTGGHSQNCRSAVEACPDT